MTITSTANERVKLVRSLTQATARQRERAFVIEGVRLVEEALQAGLRPRLALVDPEHLSQTERGAALLALLRASQPLKSLLDVTEAVLTSVTDTVAPQGVVAVLSLPEPAQNAPGGPLLLVLDGLRDPGNIGTILRAAEASGAVETVVLVGCADVYAPKVLRSAMGAHFRLRLVAGATWRELPANATAEISHRPVWLATMTGGTTYDDVNWSVDSVLVIGGEAAGAGGESRGAATGLVSIPMPGRAESLNAAMATSILLFEVARQRRATRS